MSATGTATQLGMESDQNALNMLMALLPFFVKPATYPQAGAGNGSGDPAKKESCMEKCDGLPDPDFATCILKCGGYLSPEGTLTPPGIKEAAAGLGLGGVWGEASKILVWVIAIILVLVALTLIVK